MAPMFVTSTTARGAGAPPIMDLVSRGCRLADQAPIKLAEIPSFRLRGAMIAYASPDSTYAVTRRLLDAARKSILIGIYDFTADYMKEILLQALRRGVKVALMLDLDGVAGELPIFDELRKFGCTTVPAPSCASDYVHYFRSSHEKVIVIDDTWTLVQSGNYSANSIPFNEADGGNPAHFVQGNRDMGVAIRSKPLAAFFTRVLRADMQLELDATPEHALLGRQARRITPPDLVEPVPTLLPTRLFPSREFHPETPVTITPVLSPDNYMDAVPAFLETATQSILIEQQYIHSSDTAILKLLTAIRAAMDRNPRLDVRIVLGKIFGGAKGVEKERKNLENIRKVFGLKLGDQIRFIDTRRFVHCHNKLIVVDNAAVLVSSQNWSNAAVLENREAGLLIRYPDLAEYFAAIFDSDWSTAARTLPSRPEPETIAPDALARGNFVTANYGDYVEF
jgi:phosphatidylserine/phosphatidylglycerophosphate/cardiolipin synthase-like enzyme